MGSAITKTFDFSGSAIEKKDLEIKDDRRRNSLAFYISQYIEFDNDDYSPLVKLIEKDKYNKSGGKPPIIRNSSKF